jgi:FKBP-type peptidyl-prolyl cis-trans isomerase
VILAAGACQRADDKKKIDLAAKNAGSNAAVVPPRAKSEQVAPPLDLKSPPIDAIKTSSGLVYKKLESVDGGTSAQRNDTVMIKYTGWRQSTGETFYTNRTSDQAMPLPLANTAPGFTEAMQLLKKGEKAVLWLPPSIGYRGDPAPGTSPETLVYEVEITDIIPAPSIPPDVGAPPPTAQTLTSGIKYVTVRPGTGKEKARTYDTVTFNYTAWDASGRMFDTTELRKRPAVVPPFRQTAVMEEILTSMNPGQRARFWFPADRMKQDGNPVPGMPEGVLTYEVELLTIAKGKEPPRPPSDVAAPPVSANKTEKGVFYKLLSGGKSGPKPMTTDTVRVQYTGWTTDGRMFDSSVIKGEPGEFSLANVMVGWTEAIPVMSVGDKVRFWIPAELAFKGAPGKPQGMLVFDIELIEIKPRAPIEAPTPPSAVPQGP